MKKRGAAWLCGVLAALIFWQGLPAPVFAADVFEDKDAGFHVEIPMGWRQEYDNVTGNFHMATWIFRDARMTIGLENQWKGLSRWEQDKVWMDPGMRNNTFFSYEEVARMEPEAVFEGTLSAGGMEFYSYRGNFQVGLAPEPPYRETVLILRAFFNGYALRIEFRDRQDGNRFQDAVDTVSKTAAVEQGTIPFAAYDWGGGAFLSVPADWQHRQTQEGAWVFQGGGKDSYSLTYIARQLTEYMTEEELAQYLQWGGTTTADLKNMDLQRMLGAAGQRELVTLGGREYYRFRQVEPGARTVTTEWYAHAEDGYLFQFIYRAEGTGERPCPVEVARVLGSVRYPISGTGAVMTEEWLTFEEEGGLCFAYPASWTPLEAPPDALEGELVRMKDSREDCTLIVGRYDLWAHLPADHQREYPRDTLGNNAIVALDLLGLSQKTKPVYLEYSGSNSSFLRVTAFPEEDSMAFLSVKQGVLYYFLLQSGPNYAEKAAYWQMRNLLYCTYLPEAAVEPEAVMERYVDSKSGFAFDFPRHWRNESKLEDSGLLWERMDTGGSRQIAFGYVDLWPRLAADEQQAYPREEITTEMMVYSSFSNLFRDALDIAPPEAQGALARPSQYGGRDYLVLEQSYDKAGNANQWRYWIHVENGVAFFFALENYQEEDALSAMLYQMLETVSYPQTFPQEETSSGTPALWNGQMQRCAYDSCGLAFRYPSYWSRSGMEPPLLSRFTADGYTIECGVVTAEEFLAALSGGMGMAYSADEVDNRFLLEMAQYYIVGAEKGEIKTFGGREYAAFTAPVYYYSSFGEHYGRQMMHAADGKVFWFTFQEYNKASPGQIYQQFETMLATVEFPGEHYGIAASAATGRRRGALGVLAAVLPLLAAAALRFLIWKRPCKKRRALVCAGAAYGGVVLFLGALSFLAASTSGGGWTALVAALAAMPGAAAGYLLLRWEGKSRPPLALAPEAAAQPEDDIFAEAAPDGDGELPTLSAAYPVAARWAEDTPRDELQALLETACTAEPSQNKPENGIGGKKGRKDGQPQPVCLLCGRSLPPAAKFCPYCGVSARQDTEGRS